MTSVESAKTVALPEPRPVPYERALATPRSGVSLLEARAGGSAEHLSRVLRTEKPVLAFLAATLLGFAALTSLLVALGLALMALLQASTGLAAWDEGVNGWLAAHRSPTLEHISWLGSTLAGGVAIPVVIGLFLVVFLLTRHWRLAAFVLFVVVVESGSYRVTTLFVHRDRPSVHRLESLQVDASFPSGHTAASLALYGGLALLLVSRVRNRATVALTALALVVVPAFVAWSRMYRGMHHLTDCAAGVILGVGALCVTIFAARVAGATAARRDTLTGPS